MIKYFVLLINVLGAFLISFFINQEIDIKMEAPDQVKAGEEFIVILNISKGTLESFSRFQQDLPYGLTASRLSSANADFSFENQRIRLIWLKLPRESSMTASYRVRVDERLKGSFTLDAEFSYIEGNERKNISIIGPGLISIIPDPQLSADQQIDINDFRQYALADMEKDAMTAKLTCTRRTPVQTGAREITVELLLNKGNLNKFAKIEEYIPEGFLAAEIDSKDGVFSYEQGTVKILWMNLPEEQEFTVKYKLIPDKGKSLEDLKISGSFSYIVGNQTKTLEIIEKKPDLALVNDDVKAKALPDLIQDEKKPEVLPEPAKEPAKEPVKEPAKDPVMVSKQEKPAGKTFPVATQISGDELYILEPETGVYYRVQLAAGHNQVDIPKYFSRLAVKENVRVEFHEGWRKYTVGSFIVYSEARDHRNIVWTSTPIKDAFVSAYNTGKRISVQEALMITNQKWYR